MRTTAMAGHLIRRLHQFSTQVFLEKTRAAGFDLTSVQFAALDALRAHPGIDQARLSTLIAYDRATIGGVVDRLERKGLVSREISARDRRAREVRLTDEGRAVVAAMTPVVEALQDDIVANLSASERASFLAMARKALGPDLAE
ncbi:MarR family winged helix-turn-helix transcriptional regulator [Pelagibacterium sp.]|uniref:MarR family winged helix-turn-helix transcriptional regulator n=1 Tax=Pelagibacterium sp. TaxID=1967288 RepID=UPI0032F42F73